jgi:uncharacterized protein (DUF2225 family)
MSASVFDKLEETYPSIIDMMPEDLFNTHEFMLKLVQEYQELYVQALIEYSQIDQPSLMVIGQISRRLKERDDLVIYIRSVSIENLFEKKHDFEVWQKVQRQP